MSLNHILLWLSSLSCLVNLYIAWRGGAVGWVGVSVGILLVNLVAWWWVPDVAGYWGGSFWVVLVMIPGLANRVITSMVMKQQYGAASVAAGLVRWLHPMDGFWQQPEIYHALHLNQQGKIEEANAIFDRLQSHADAIGKQALFHLYSTQGRWQDINRWFQEFIPEPEIMREPWLLSTKIRALGEIGQLNELLRAYRKYEKALLIPHQRVNRYLAYLFIFSFCGRRTQVERILKEYLTYFPEVVRTFWLATADYADDGDLETYRNVLTGLCDTPDLGLRQRISLRLENHTLVTASEALTSEGLSLLSELTEAFDHEHAYRQPAEGGKKFPAVTWFLVAVNLGVFLLELPGGSEDLRNLYQLGAVLIPTSIQTGEFWRIVAANFLHLGPIHLTLNVLSLLFFGPFAERALGWFKFLLTYLLAGIGSVTLYSLVMLVIAQPGEHGQMLVGASGGIMGIVGCHAGIALKRYREDKIKDMARRHLLGISVILALQTFFDLVTPHVGMVVHLLGFGLGGFLGYTLLPKAKSPLPERRGSPISPGR